MGTVSGEVGEIEGTLAGEDWTMEVKKAIKLVGRKGLVKL